MEPPRARRGWPVLAGPSCSKCLGRLLGSPAKSPHPEGSRVKAADLGCRHIPPSAAGGFHFYICLCAPTGRALARRAILASRCSRAREPVMARLVGTDDEGRRRLQRRDAGRWALLGTNRSGVVACQGSSAARHPVVSPRRSVCSDRTSDETEFSLQADVFLRRAGRPRAGSRRPSSRSVRSLEPAPSSIACRPHRLTFSLTGPAAPIRRVARLDSTAPAAFWRSPAVVEKEQQTLAATVPPADALRPSSPLGSTSVDLTTIQCAPFRGCRPPFIYKYWPARLCPGPRPQRHPRLSLRSRCFRSLAHRGPVVSTHSLDTAPPTRPV